MDKRMTCIQQPANSIFKFNVKWHSYYLYEFITSSAYLPRHYNGSMCYGNRCDPHSRPIECVRKRDTGAFTRRQTATTISTACLYCESSQMLRYKIRPSISFIKHRRPNGVIAKHRPSPNSSDVIVVVFSWFSYVELYRRYLRNVTLCLYSVNACVALIWRK